MDAVYLVPLLADTLVVTIVLIVVTLFSERSLAKQHSPLLFCAIVTLPSTAVYFICILLISYYNLFKIYSAPIINDVHLVINTLTLATMLAFYTFFLKKGVEQDSRYLKGKAVLSGIIAYFLWRFLTLYLDIFYLFQWRIMGFIEILVDVFTVGIMLIFFTWAFGRHYNKKRGFLWDLAFMVGLYNKKEASLQDFALLVGVQGAIAYFICRFIITYIVVNYIY